MLENLNGFSCLFAILNLIILYVVLKKILFKPVTEFMENRTKAIQDAIADAEKQNAEALEMKQSYQLQINEAKADGQKIIDEATAKANRNYDKLTADAKDQAKQILESARKEIDLERAQMLKSVRAEVAGMALAAASKVMEANMNTEANSALVDRFLDEAGVA